MCDNPKKKSTSSDYFSFDITQVFVDMPHVKQIWALYLLLFNSNETPVIFDILRQILAFLLYFRLFSVKLILNVGQGRELSRLTEKYTLVLPELAFPKISSSQF